MGSRRSAAGFHAPWCRRARALAQGPAAFDALLDRQGVGLRRQGAGECSTMGWSWHEAQQVVDSVGFGSPVCQSVCD